MATADVVLTSKAFTLVGTGATFQTGSHHINVGAGCAVQVRDLSGSSYACTLTTDTSTLTLTGISGNLGDFTGYSFTASNCTVQVSRSNLIGFMANQGADVTIDRALVTGQWWTVIPSGSGVRIHVTNSVFANISETVGFNTPVNNAAVDVNLAYDTFYNDQQNPAFICPTNSVDPSAFVLTNDIFFAPGTGNGDAITSQGTPISCSADTNVEYPQSTVIGTGVVTLDPRLVDPANGNFHLMSVGPAIDTAKVIANDATHDFDGTTRPQGPRNDIGAFEYH
jgi:hypothetical protein